MKYNGIKLSGIFFAEAHVTDPGNQCVLTASYEWIIATVISRLFTFSKHDRVVQPDTGLHIRHLIVPVSCNQIRSQSENSTPDVYYVTP